MASKGGVTVVTSPGNWTPLAAALDEVCSESERFPLVVDGTGAVRRQSARVEAAITAALAKVLPLCTLIVVHGIAKAFAR